MEESGSLVGGQKTTSTSFFFFFIFRIKSYFFVIKNIFFSISGSGQGSTCEGVVVVISIFRFSRYSKELKNSIKLTNLIKQHQLTPQYLKFPIVSLCHQNIFCLGYNVVFLINFKSTIIFLWTINEFLQLTIMIKFRLTNDKEKTNYKLI